MGKTHTVTKRPRRRRQRRRSGAALPQWGDLASAGKRVRAGRKARRSLLERVTTGRFALCILVLAAAVTLYVGHVHATQDILVSLQQARSENQRLHLKLGRLKGEFDRITGPSVVYRRARELGLEESVLYGPTIYLDAKE